LPEPYLLNISENFLNLPVCTFHHTTSAHYHTTGDWW